MSIIMITMDKTFFVVDLECLKEGEKRNLSFMVIAADTEQAIRYVKSDYDLTGVTDCKWSAKAVNPTRVRAYQIAGDLIGISR